MSFYEAYKISRSHFITMSSENLSSIMESAVAASLPRLIHVISKHLKNGKTEDEIYEAMTDQKSAPKEKSRSFSEVRKTPSRATSRNTVSTKSTSEKRQWVSFDVYKSEHKDSDVCTYIPSRGDNSSKICAADVKDPGTSDKSRVRCGQHKKIDPDGSAQRFNKIIESKSSRREDTPEVTDQYKPPMASASSRLRTTSGVPRAFGRQRQSTPDKKQESDDEIVTPVRRNGLTAAPMSSTRRSLDDKTPTGAGARTNPLSHRMTRTPVRSEEKSDDDDTKVAESPPVHRLRNRSSDKKDQESSSSRRQDTPKESSRRQTTPPKESSRRQTTPVQDDDTSSIKTATTVQRDEDSSARRRLTRVSRREETPEPEPEESSEIVSYSVPNASGYLFIKINPSRFLVIENETSEPIGICPLEIKDGEKIVPVWKSKLIKKYSDSELELIKRLNTDE